MLISWVSSQRTSRNVISKGTRWRSCRPRNHFRSPGVGCTGATRTHERISGLFRHFLSDRTTCLRRESFSVVQLLNSSARPMSSAHASMPPSPPAPLIVRTRSPYKACTTRSNRCSAFFGCSASSVHHALTNAAPDPTQPPAPTV
ncbi:hypothetical protein ADL03_06795 [Nocardia sp. NRRL S-836]|nr:hypothetical protein ADL03_06795 [Nocardia sp. NRRL S-836]